MRSGPPTDLLASALGYRVEAESWLGADLLADDVPIAGGSFTFDTGTQVIESASLSVAALDHVRSWVPSVDPRHPLARFGQELLLTAVTFSDTREWRTPIGRVIIHDWKDDGADVDVEVRGLLHRVAEARLTRVATPSKDGTLESEFRRLMLGGIPVDVDAALVDRDCPSSFQWEEDRLAALFDLANAWPALIVPDGVGGVRLIPPLDDTVTPVLTVTDGEGGVVVSAPRADTREQVYNGVIATSQRSEGTASQVRGEAWVTEGVYRADGPYGPVPRFFPSPLLGTTAQCEAAAASILAKSLRPSRVVDVTMPVDPRIESYDPMRVTYRGDTFDGYVIKGTLPVVPGDMTVTVGIV